ncbi:immunity 7 family protein [Mechercharimyces sp. CAU 1602]|uniref:immunity 7 family protein n=1 Tax=Mechercharimyces sp. CAU 1602 TaxID=2973933 RepID=UPI0021623622|nr:immunity 7 family protein [Mechercharimyces sp. CAU 1602]MCS1350882.1 immunity 7 family protein [Mechercharimyces sp. CAU 1602]
MYEFHGWVTLQLTSGDEDDDELERAVHLIKMRMKELKWGNDLLKLGIVNGYYYLHTVGMRNRAPLKKLETDISPIEFFRYVATTTPGSYGLLYIIDHQSLEDPTGTETQVYVMKRGSLNQQVDPFFKPFIPVVEDPYDVMN